MRVPRHTRQRIINRARFVAQFLGSDLPATSLDSALAGCASLIEKSHLTVEQRIILCFQIAMARFPSAGELVQSDEKIRFSGALAVIHDIFRSFSFREFCAKGDVYELSQLPANTILTDITHTRQYPFTSGIQRVVRQLCNNMLLANYPVKLVAFDKNQVLCQLTTEELERFSHPPKGKAPRFRTFRRFINLAGRILVFLSEKMPAIERVRMVYVNFWYYLRIIRELFLRNDKTLQSPFVWGNKYFLPEVALAKYHADSLLTIFRYVPSESAMILFDLIPLTHPELCVVAPAFLVYAQLAKYVRKISCISKSVESDLRAYLKVVSAPKVPVKKIGYHYLGFDFTDSGQAKNNSRSLTDILPGYEPARPMVTCLGTIEPRKNQIRVLRAAVRLMRNGVDFQMVFLGLPGWMSHSFLRELAAAQAAGLAISLVNSLPDSEVAKIIQSSQFTVFASLTEGFGLPIIESIALGKPCITSNLGATREIALAVGACLLVDPSSVDDLEGAIRRLLTDQALMKRKTSESARLKWVTWADYARNVYAFLK